MIPQSDHQQTSLHPLAPSNSQDDMSSLHLGQLPLPEINDMNFNTSMFAFDSALVSPASISTSASYFDEPHDTIVCGGDPFAQGIPSNESFFKTEDMSASASPILGSLPQATIVGQGSVHTAPRPHQKRSPRKRTEPQSPPSPHTNSPKSTSQEPQYAPSRSRAQERNRLAATKCRRRKRNAAESLATREKAMEDRHRTLIAEFDALTSEIYTLKTMLLRHSDCDCELIQRYIAHEARKSVDGLMGGGVVRSRTVSSAGSPLGESLAGMSNRGSIASNTGFALDSETYHPEAQSLSWSQSAAMPLEQAVQPFHAPNSGLGISFGGIADLPFGTQFMNGSMMPDTCFGQPAMQGLHSFASPSWAVATS